MRVGQIPHDVWGWRSTTVVVMFVVLPQIAIMQMVPEARSLSGAAIVSGFVVFPVIGLTAVLLYLHWRITSSQGTAWVSACLAIIAVNGFTFAALRTVAGDEFHARPGWMLLLDLALAAGLLVLLILAERITMPADPIFVGLAVGMCVTEVDLIVGKTASPLGASDAIMSAGDALLLAIGVGIGFAITRLTTIPRWAASRLALSVVALCVNRAVTGYDSSYGVLLDGLALATGVLGAVLLCMTALALVRQAIRDDRREVRSLHNQLATLEAEGRADRAKLHEIKGTIAGIASASRLIRHADGLPSNGRNRLEEMLEAESLRLERLVRAGDGVDEDDQLESRVDLDQAIGPVVQAHRAQGRTVHWQPSGQTAHGRRDDIAEVVNILLDNAAKHAPAAPAGVDVSRQNGTIEIVVFDEGPGVSADLGRQLFDWGARGPDSKGQGIGLNIAHRLMDTDGNYLRLADSAAPGATFVVGLRAIGDSRDSADGRA